MSADLPAPENAAAHKPVSYGRHFVLLACGWTVALAVSLAWSLGQIDKEVLSLTAQTARALLEKDLLYREWSIMRGGVYVPEPGLTLANAEGEREIRTPSGRVLALLNPAQVSRQIFQIQGDKTGIRGDITSLKPNSLANLPDAWERQALGELPPHGDQDTTNEVSSVETRQGERYFRMMRPLYTTATCLQCHEEAGRKVGELRGGISAMVPMNGFVTPGERRSVAGAYVGLWLLGLAGLFFGVRDLKRQAQARELAEARARQITGDLKQALDEVSTLSRLIPICASCKKIRDDKGYWTQLEAYMEMHSDLRFSHGLCVECLHKLYPEVAGMVMEQMAAKAAAADPATSAGDSGARES